MFIQTCNTAVDEQISEIHQVRPGRFVKVSVSDTGTGMDEGTLKQVFDPFFTTKEGGRGTGLGMASAYGIIRNHGGFITVNSGIGQGSCFNLYLPASASDLSIEESKTGQLDIEHGHETILVVDDEPHVLELSANMLEQMGYKVLAAGSGAEAIEIYQAGYHTIDLVVLDMVMPELSGRETFDRLKQTNPEIRVLISTGYSQSDHVEYIMQNSRSVLIHKPFDIGNFSQKIREALGHPVAETFII